jgi:hypothetical protein
MSLLQKSLSPEIPSIHPRESGGTGFPACADERGYLRHIILISFDKDHIGILVAINVGPAFNTHLHKLGSLCYQPKMNFAGTSIGKSVIVLPIMPQQLCLAERP